MTSYDKVALCLNDITQSITVIINVSKDITKVEVVRIIQERMDMQ